MAVDAKRLIIFHLFSAPRHRFVENLLKTDLFKYCCSDWEIERSASKREREREPQQGKRVCDSFEYIKCALSSSKFGCVCLSFGKYRCFDKIKSGGRANDSNVDWSNKTNRRIHTHIQLSAKMAIARFSLNFNGIHAVNAAHAINSFRFVWSQYIFFRFSC